MYAAAVRHTMTKHSIACQQVNGLQSERRQAGSFMFPNPDTIESEGEITIRPNSHSLGYEMISLAAFVWCSFGRRMRKVCKSSLYLCTQNTSREEQCSVVEDGAMCTLRCLVEVKSIHVSFN